MNNKRGDSKEKYKNILHRVFRLMFSQVRINLFLFLFVSLFRKKANQKLNFEITTFVYLSIYRFRFTSNEIDLLFLIILT